MLYRGDCRALMAEMDEASIDAIVTDPPYELAFMGRAWDASGVAFDPATWRAALRVLKPGGHLLAFGGSRTYHRLACAIEDAGFEIRDQIMWIYGSGFPKSKNIGDGLGTALKPAHEPIVMARKPLVGTVAGNVSAHGTGAINIDACRVGDTVETWPASRARAAAGLPNALYTHRLNGSTATDTVSAGPPPPGRWPANVIHDGSDEVLDAFPSAPGQQGDLAGHSKDRLSRGIFGDMRAARDAVARGDAGSAARFFYCAKASKADRDEGLADFVPQAFVQFQTANGTSGKASSLSEGRETQYRNIHPTVKPTTLMRYLCRLVTPAGGLILDPFTGSGSTGKAAILEGFRFVGCELTEEYLPIARARIAAADARVSRSTAQPELFGEAQAV